MSHETHNKGQTDASESKFERPHSHLEELFTWQKDSLEELYKDNNDYSQGQKNHHDQVD